MQPAEHVLRTSFENIGAIFHTAVVIFNAATIERGVPFYFYQDMTPAIADFLLQLDGERLELGRVYGMDLLPITAWIRKAYPDSRGQTLCELMRSNPAYHDIRAPQTLASRYLLEDIPDRSRPLLRVRRGGGIASAVDDIPDPAGKRPDELAI
jgi:opine dehydrogenase